MIFVIIYFFFFCVFTFNADAIAAQDLEPKSLSEISKDNKLEFNINSPRTVALLYVILLCEIFKL